MAAMVNSKHLQVHENFFHPDLSLNLAFAVSVISASVH